MRAQDCDGGFDLGIVGIPCPLFSILNQRRLKVPGYNPFTEHLGSILDETVD